MEISINVKDNLLKDFGIIHVQEFLQRQLQLYELQISANRITKHLQSTNVNWEHELEQQRQSAWDDYKQKFFKPENDE